MPTQSMDFRRREAVRPREYWDDEEEQIMPYDNIVNTTLPKQLEAFVEYDETKFTDIIDKIYNLIQEDKCIAIHCQAGISRSVTFLASLLILHYRKVKYEFNNLDNVLNFIKEQRPEADPNDEFKRFLTFLINC